MKTKTDPRPPKAAFTPTHLISVLRPDGHVTHTEASGFLAADWSLSAADGRWYWRGQIAPDVGSVMVQRILGSRATACSACASGETPWRGWATGPGAGPARHGWWAREHSGGLTWLGRTGAEVRRRHAERELMRCGGQP